MRSRLWVRLLAAFLAVALLAVGAVALIVRSATETSFRRYVDQSSAPPFAAEQVAMLQDYYAARGSWAGVASVLTDRVEGEGAGCGPGCGRGARGRPARLGGSACRRLRHGHRGDGPGAGRRAPGRRRAEPGHTA
ncbi:MAG: hypothetical protein M5R40_15060 [Anaerolineae bacterium]|nr:hypothetical protein [Anaerolineae bacterium]